MRVIRLLLVLFVCAVPALARADTFDLSGVKHDPGVTFTYSFSVQQVVEPSFILDILNGFVLTHQPAFGCKPCTTTYTNDFFEFGPSDTITLASFGNWNLLGSVSGVKLVDPPAATPEGSTQLYLLVAIGLGLLGMLARTQK
jgi:hypothetical protein